MELEINGIKYKKIEKQPKKQLSKGMTKVLMMAAMFGGLDECNKSSFKNRPNVNIIDEFELIQNKKSKLSMANRDWVVFQFNKLFKQI